MAKKMATSRTISITSIWDATYLNFCGIQFLKTEVCDGKIIFVFPSTPEIENMLQKFSQNPEVRIQEYISIFQRLKNLIYAEKRNGKGERKWTKIMDG